MVTILESSSYKKKKNTKCLVIDLELADFHDHRLGG